MSVGKAIRNIRGVKGWTQHDLAAFLGVTQQRVSEWERDLHTPSAGVVARLVKLMSDASIQLIDALAMQADREGESSGV